MKNIKKIMMYSTDWCSDCFRARIFFDQNDIVYEEVNIEHDEDARKFVEQTNNGKRTVPTIFIEFEDSSKSILVEPTIAELQNVFRQ